MMRVPIPQDWNGEDWFCVQVEWPDSPQYVGLLAGLLTQLTRGRFWDERDGTITQAQEVAWAIYDRNFPLTLCADDNGEGITEPDLDFLASVCETQEEQMLMTLCGYNPKAFKIEDGTLYVRDFCGDWVAIGELPGGEGVTPEDIYEGQDPQPTFYQCGKANLLVDQFIALSDSAWDHYDDPIGIEANMESDVHPSVNLSTTRVYQWIAQILLFEPLFDKSFFNHSTAIQKSKCIAAPQLNADGLGTDSETEIVVNAMAAAFQDVQGGLTGSHWYAYWDFVRSTFGAADCRKLLALGSSDDTADCTCPEDQAVGQPQIYFDGTRQGPQGSGFVVEAFEVQYSGRRVRMRINSFGYGDKHFTDFEPNLAGAVLGDSIKIRVYPTPGAANAGVPAEVSGIDTATIDESQWCNVFIQELEGSTVRTDGSGYVEFHNNGDPTDAIQRLDHQGWKYPISEDENVIFDYCFEIVEINGVPLTPLGP